MEKRIQQIKPGEIFRIAITGPESTGKSTLAEQLAQHFKTGFRPEYAREYLGFLDRPYEFNDIELIAREQIKTETEWLKTTNQIFIADTELLVIKIWMEHKYHHCPSWVLNEIEANPYDLYLLCDIDIPWKPDPQREHPNMREYFFGLFHDELVKRKFNFVVITGAEKKRLNLAIQSIEKYLIK